MERWAAGERISPLVDLKKIDRVPISIVHPIVDLRCEVELNAEWVYNQIQSKDKHIQFINLNHYSFIYRGDWDLMVRLANTIETGKSLAGRTAISGAAAFLGLFLASFV